MANDVYAIDCGCRSCTHSHTWQKHRQLELFSTDGPSEYVGMNILRPLPKKEESSPFVFHLAYRYVKLMKATQTSKRNTMTVARIFLENWVDNFGILLKPLINMDLWCVPRFFVAVCSTLGMNNIVTIEYQPETSSQTKSFNSTILSRLHHYVSEQETD